MKRIYYFIILFFCSLLLISCRGEVPQEFVLAGPAEPQALSIVRVTPEGSVLEENQTDTISVSFNQAIVPLSILPEDETEGPLQFDPAIAGKYRWMGTSTLTFIPDSPLPYGTSYKATVPSGLKALTGALLEKEYTWNFETLRPAYKDRSPSDSGLLPLKGPLYILFNQPVSPEKAGNFLKLYCDNKDIPLITEKTSDKDKLPENWNKENTLLIKPEEKLETSKVYTLRLLKGLPGETGDLGLEEEVSLEFKSENIFAFKEIVGGKNHQPEDEAGFKFTNPVSYKELMKNIKFEPSIEINENYDTFSDTDTPYLYLSLLPKREYKVTLSKDMKDVFGNTLGKDVKTSFNTKDYLPSIFIEGGTCTVESNSERLFPVSLMNIDKVKLQMANISRDEIIPLLRWYLVDAESLKDVKKQLSSEIPSDRLNKLDSLTGRKICRANYPVILKELGFSKEEIKTIEGYYYLFKSALAYGETYNPGDGFYNVNRLWETGVKKNKFTWLPLKLDEALGAKKTGFVFLQLDAMNDGIDGTLSKAFVQVTNLGVTGKFSKDNNFICVRTLDTAEPVPGAHVELRGDENKILWTGKTGEDGTLETPGWQSLGLSQNDCDVWAFVTSGNDTSVINSSGSWSVRLYSFDIYNYQSPDNELNTCIFTDKGVYRGGEDIHFKGTVREKIEGKWEVPSVIKKVSITLCNSRNEEVVKEDLSLSGYGSFDYTFKLDEDAPSGDWYIALSAEVNKEEYSLCYKSFLVEDYEAAQFEVTVESDKEYYLTGDKFSGKIKGWYLFGAPMRGEKITWYSDMAPSYYEPPGYSGFDFNTDFFCEESDTVTTGNGEGKLDESGVFPLDFEIKSEKPKGPCRLSVQGEVASAGRQFVSGYQEFMVHPGEFYTGVKLKKRFMASGSTQTFEVIALTPEGEIAEGRDLKVEVLERQWNSVRKQGLNGKFQWFSEKTDKNLESFDVKSKKEAHVLEFKPKKSGLYVIKAIGTDSRGNDIITESTFYVSGSDYVAWERFDDDRIELVADKEEYKPGDTASILVKSPYENARALVTIERENIIKSFFTEVKGSACTIEIPVEKDYLPNVYISVILYQGRVSENKYDDTGEDLGKPSFKIGYVNLPVLPDGKKLSVTLNTDKEEYEPGEEVTVDINLKDSGRQGVTGEVTLWVVDVGVLNLTAFETPDYFDYFYRERPLMVETSETRLKVIGQKNYGQKGDNPGGGGSTGPSPRKDFVATPYFNPSVITDKEGNASIKFKLPDNITTFRIMATAQTKDSHFGAGEKRIVAKKPLLLKPSMPAFARLHDKFKAGVLVFNGTGIEGHVIVTAESEGLKLKDSGIKKIAIPPGEEKEVLFSFEAMQVCEGKLTISAEMNEFQDAIEKKIVVKKPVITETVATSGLCETSSEEAISIPLKVDKNTGSLSVTTSSTAMVDLKGGLEYLASYPYECLEQKLSKVLPFITAEDLINAFALSDLKGKDLHDAIQKDLIRISKHQVSSGGFTLWEKGPYESPFLSAYTLYTLYLAKKSGYDVDEQTMASGIKYLKEVLRYGPDDERWNYPYDSDSQLTTKSFSLYVLYLFNEGEASYIHNLYKKRNDMSLFGKAMLLRSIHIYGKDGEEEKTLVKELMNSIKISPTSIHFEEEEDKNLAWIYSSCVRTTAFILQTFLETGVDFPDAHKVVKWLVDEQKQGRWDSTQENVFAFEALRTYFERFEKSMPDFEATVSFDGKEFLKNFFKGRDLNVVGKDIPVSEIPKGRDVPLVFQKEGPGKLYYTVRLDYAPTEPRPARDEGLTILKTITPVDKDEKVVKDSYRGGEVYKITLSVVTPQERNYVVVDDPVPGGFEVLRESFATENKALLNILREIRDDERTSWWGTFDHWERYEDRVVLFADQLNPGEHNFTYIVRATHYGTFNMPPAKGELMYEPEVFGYSAGKTINVVQ